MRYFIDGENFQIHVGPVDAFDHEFNLICPCAPKVSVSYHDDDWLVIRHNGIYTHGDK